MSVAWLVEAQRLLDDGMPFHAIGIVNGTVFGIVGALIP
jgi:hypothetical protein